MTREEAINEIKSWDFLEGKEIEAIQTLIPELRESEDERIRKEIIDFIQWAEDRGMTRHDYHQAKRPAVWIAYLEKQKECVADSSKTSAEEDERIRARLIEYFQGFLEGYEDCYKDGGCVKWEGLDVKSILAWLEKQKETADSFTDGIIEVRSFQRGMEEGRKLERQKEQKHPNGCFTCDEYKKGYEEGRRNGFTAGYNKAMKEVEQKEQKPVVTLGETYHVDTLGTQQVIAGKMPQKPAEWSEENEDMLNSCISSIEEAKENRYAYKETDGDTSYDHEIDWLKSLRPQQKVEWSEEDEEMFQEALTDIIYAKNELNKKGCEGLAKSALDAFNWLNMRFKSLRPQPQGIYQQVVKGLRDMCDRYEQNGMFTDERARDFLGNVRVKCKDAIECAAILDEPSWKPSEEQMEALNRVRTLNPGLDALYQQLKNM